MVKREIQRKFDKYGKYLEPFEVMFLLLLFALPVIAVMNLSPQTGTPPNQEKVLGLTNTEEAEVEEIGGTHEFITDEHLYTESSSSFNYQATLLRRDPGIYTKPIISVSNPTPNEITVRFTLTDAEESSTQIGVMRDSVNYIVKDSEGEKFPREFVLNPGDEAIFHIDIRNKTTKNFEETLQLRIDLYGLEEELNQVGEFTENPSDEVEVEAIEGESYEVEEFESITPGQNEYDNADEFEDVVLELE